MGILNGCARGFAIAWVVGTGGHQMSSHFSMQSMSQNATACRRREWWWNHSIPPYSPYKLKSRIGLYLSGRLDDYYHRLKEQILVSGGMKAYERRETRTALIIAHTCYNHIVSIARSHTVFDSVTMHGVCFRL